MTKEILIRELRRIAIEDQHRCYGCGFEHSCGIRGCAIIREAVERLETEPSNAPLTLAELREMTGAWVWVVVRYEHCKCDGWAKIITHSMAAYFEQHLFFRDYGKAWLAYRRKPEEGTT